MSVVTTDLEQAVADAAAHLYVWGLKDIPQDLREALGDAAGRETSVTGQRVLQTILRNVTDLARAKEEIEESYRTLRVAQAEVRDERHRLDLIIDSVADPILVTDQEGDIVLMNTPAERLFNAPGLEDEAALRRVRANGANLT